MSRRKGEFRRVTWVTVGGQNQESGWLKEVEPGVFHLRRPNGFYYRITQDQIVNVEEVRR